MGCETHKTFRGVIFKRGETNFRAGIRLVVQRHEPTVFLKLGQADFHRA
jgi:hypothetical protein